MTNVLVLRPEPGAAATARAASGLGLVAVVAPLFRIEPVAWAPADARRYDALMLTSAAAVRHAGAQIGTVADLPVHAVGEATAAVARAAGLRVVAVGDGDAAALLAAMADAGVGRALHLCGADVAEAVAPTVVVERRVVYRAVAVDHLPDAAVAALDRGAVALLHSPRAAALLADLLPAGPIRARVAAAAISPRARAALGDGWGRLAIAARPSDEALLAAAADMCDGRHRQPSGEGAWS